MLSTKPTISQKLKIAKKTHELKNPFQNIAHLLERFFLQKILPIMIDHSRKLKIGKLIFHSFQNIAQQFEPKNGDGYLKKILARLF